MDITCITVRRLMCTWFLLLLLSLLHGCESFKRQPTKKDIKNEQSAVTIEQKQEQIKVHTKAIEVLAEESIEQSEDIQDRSQGGWQFPSWVYWVGGIALLAYLGLLPVVLGIGVRIVHKIASGLKEVDYG